MYGVSVARTSATQQQKFGHLSKGGEHGTNWRLFTYSTQCRRLDCLFNARGSPGSGSEGNGWLFFILGGIWTLSFTYASWAMCARGKNDVGLLIAFLTWPAAGLVGMAVKLGALAVSDLKSPSPEFQLACKSAGPRFLAKPANPVHSIAYDWEGSARPFLNTFQVASSGRIMSSGYHMPAFPSAIEFTEVRCGVNVGCPGSSNFSYVRLSNGNNAPHLGITELTADALVRYKISTAGSSDKDFHLRQVDLIVSDRRDGQTLATLRYVSDINKKKLCGTTSQGVMDESAFVREAIGLNELSTAPAQPPRSLR